MRTVVSVGTIPAINSLHTTMTVNNYCMDDQADKVNEIESLLNQGRKSEARALAAEINLTAARRGWKDPDGKGRNWFQVFCDDLADYFKTVTGKSLA